MIKGRGQRLIPEELLKYLETYKENHPDPAGGGGATLEDIVDSAGNKRFIEGTITSLNATMGALYTRWSLSGTHLMIVFAGTTTGSVSISTDRGKFAVINNIPEWILGKIKYLNESWNKTVSFSTFVTVTTGGTISNSNIALRKVDNTLILSSSSSSLSINADVNYRFQFDLLIDADYSD